jgi:hypothetical protein
MCAKSITERFWSKVDVKGEDECWEWQGAKSSGGYGNFLFDNKPKNAHRIAFLLEYGYLTEGLDVCHSCDNIICCNPRHLWEGTAKQNMEDMVKKGRRHSSVGSKNSFSKTTEEDVIRIRELVAKGTKQVTICRMYGLHKATVSHIVSRRTWQHI